MLYRLFFAGTHGISHALPAIASAAARLTEHPVHFAFVGEGADKPRLARTVAELGLRNVTLRPGVPHEEIPGLLAAADVCLVPLRDVPLFATFIPSKMFEYLAAGKAVIGSVRGEAAEILREAGAVVVPPEDDAALAGAIRDLAADPERRPLMGQAGRRHVEQSFRPGRAGPRVPEDPHCAGRPPMRLLVTGGSGFLGAYVLNEAARRGHETVALARSDAAAGAVARYGARPLTALEASARLVLTDSGGVQGNHRARVPCLTLRDRTERPVTIAEGTNRLVGRDPDRIVAAALEVIADPPPPRTPAPWDGKSGQRIAAALVAGHGARSR